MTYAEALALETKFLRTHAPELQDTEMRKQFHAAVLKTGRECGFSAQEIEAVADHRVLLLLRYAAMHLGLWKSVWSDPV